MFVTPEIVLAAGAAEVTSEAAEVAAVAAEVAEAAEIAESAVQLESPFCSFDTELVTKSWLDSNILEMTAPSLQETAEVQKLIPKQQLEAARGWIKDINPHYAENIEWGAPEMYNWGYCALQVEEKLLEAEANAMAVSEVPYEGMVPISPSIQNLRTLNSAEGLENALQRKFYFIEKDQILSKMQELGPGSHVVAGVTRKPVIPALDGILPEALNNRADYWFNLFYDGDKLYTLNGHMGFIVEGLLQPKNEDKWMILL